MASHVCFASPNSIFVVGLYVVSKWLTYVGMEGLSLHVEQRIWNIRVSRAHATLHNNDLLALVRFDDGHAGDWATHD